MTKNTKGMEEAMVWLDGVRREYDDYRPKEGNVSHRILFVALDQKDSFFTSSTRVQTCTICMYMKVYEGLVYLKTSTYLYSWPQSPTVLYKAIALSRPGPNATCSINAISLGLSSKEKTRRLAAALFDTPSLVPAMTAPTSGLCNTQRVATFEMST